MGGLKTVAAYFSLPRGVGWEHACAWGLSGVGGKGPFAVGGVGFWLGVWGYFFLDPNFLMCTVFLEDRVGDLNFCSIFVPGGGNSPLPPLPMCAHLPVFIYFLLGACLL